jgi:hypothetical protein
MARSDDEKGKGLAERLAATRMLTLDLAAPLSDADATIQPHPDASPAKWHLAHTTWFFETFILRDHVAGYELHDERWPYLFNSYYNGEGERHARPKRGMISRPSLDDVRSWRIAVDEALQSALPGLSSDALQLVELGINHEQQHQELFLTDILATFAENPIEPAYGVIDQAACYATEPLGWIDGQAGEVEIGAPAMGSPSTANGRATGRYSARIASPIAASPMASGNSSSKMADIARPPCGLAMAGTGFAAKESSGRSIGMTMAVLSRWPDVGKSTSRRRSLMSAFMRQTPLHDGPEHDFREKRSGKPRSLPPIRWSDISSTGLEP